MIPREWFFRPVTEVARDLLGARLTHRTSEGPVTIRLVEVEAYCGADDPASHAYRGPSARNRSMFGDAGHLYVYRHMGLHYCANIVTGPPGLANGILLRAGEVVDGIELARARRAAAGVTRSGVDLAQGPARLTVALGIVHNDDGADILAANSPFTLQLSPPIPDSSILTSSRIGINNAGADAAKYPWRFWISGDPHVSSHHKARR